MTPLKTGVRLQSELVANRHPPSKHNSCQYKRGTRIEPSFIKTKTSNYYSHSRESDQRVHDRTHHNEIRKTQNQHLIIICQNFICL